MQLQRYITLSLFFLAITVCHIVFAEMLPPSDDPDAPPPPTWVPIPANHTPAAPSKLVTTGSVERIQSGVLDLATGEYTVTFSSKTNESCAHIGSCVQCITNSCGVEPCPGNTSCHVDRYVPDPVNQTYFYMRLVTLPQGKDSYVYVKAPGVFQAYSDACVIGSGYNYVSALFQRPNSRSTSKVTYAVRNIVGPRNTNGKYHTWSFAEGGYIAVYAYDADIYQSFCLHSLLLISTPLKNGNFYYDTAAFDAALTLWSSHSATC